MCQIILAHSYCPLNRPLYTTAQEATSHDILPSEEYLLHRILHGVPEGSPDISPMHAFPMDSNLDVMGARKCITKPYKYTRVNRAVFSGLQKGLLCWSGIDGPHIPHRRHSKANISCSNSKPKYNVCLIVHLEKPVSFIAFRSPEFSSAAFGGHSDIKAVSANPDRQGPRPRGTGKLLSSHGGVGLALLRLEHVAAVERGDLQLEFEVADGDKTYKWSVSPWWPHWWPRDIPPASETTN